MTTYKGGRGVKAPYDSITMRVPMPIKDKVQQMVDDYRNNQDINSDEILDINTVVDLARDILSQKKNAKTSLQKLIKSIYGKDVAL